MSERLTITAFWLALTFTSYTAVAQTEVLSSPRISDVVLHMTAFFVLTGLLQMAYLPSQGLRAAVLLFGYGLLIEGVQLWLPHRSAELKDLLVDALGIAMGLVGYRWFGNSAKALLRSWIG